MSINPPSRPLADHLEDVPIETIQIGDFVFLDDTARARCVLGLATTRHRVSNRVIGWLVELEGGASAWLRRGARVKRRALH